MNDANLRTIEVRERFSGKVVWSGLASSAIHAMDLYAVEAGFGPYSALIQEPDHERCVYAHDGKLWGIFTNTEIYVELGNAEEVANAMLVRGLIARGKREILEDVANGTVPATIRTFGDLHDHVDANEYAGLCDPAIFDLENEDQDLARYVQDRLHEWIASGEMLSEAKEKQPPNERITAVVRDAQEAFWARVAACFGEVTTGDLDPLTVVAFERECTQVVNTWLHDNHPFWLGREDH